MRHRTPCSILLIAATTVAGALVAPGCAVPTREEASLDAVGHGAPSDGRPACTCTPPPNAGGAPPPPAGGAPQPPGVPGGASGAPSLLIGQSNLACWDDFATVADGAAGGSIYYEIKSGQFGGGPDGLHARYGRFLAEAGKAIQIGVSWKDNPPGWDGSGDNAPFARAATAAMAKGEHDGKLRALIDFVRAYPRARFLVRVDYEVSSHYHCTDATCASYKAAFNHVADVVRREAPGADVRFVFHPVRGEYELLYPGDARVDEIGVSIFNHELCLPVHDQGRTFTNGEPGRGYDVGAQKCMGYTLARTGDGLNASPALFDYDANVLGMMQFAKEHRKTMIVSEAAPMNLAAGGGPEGTEDDATVALWVRRLFGLLNYRGPLPNREGVFDLSGVVRTIVYINADLRYGWDGKRPGQTAFQFPVDADWHVNASISRYGKAKSAFCDGLATHGFAARCRGGGDAR